MNKVLETDVAVVGAGIAGLSTALRLRELGIRTVVLERSEEERYPCNTRIAGGAFHVAHRDTDDDPQVIREAISARVRGTAHPELVDAMANDARSSTAWLAKKGVRFMRVGDAVYRRHTLAPPIAVTGRNYWEGRGGDVLLRTLGGAYDKAGGTFLRGSRARRLLMEGGRCVGVEVEQKPGCVQVKARSVVICDGGFHANLDLVRQYISPAPEKLKQRNAQAGHGDGLMMAQEVGGKLVGMDRIYGHVLAQEAMHNDDLWPFPIMDFLCTGGIVVDAGGRRFTDEGRGGVAVTNAIARLQDPLSAVVIFDAAIWEGPGREYLQSANPLLVRYGGNLMSAPDLASLARQLDMPADALAQTVAEYNAAVDAGQTAALQPTRTATAHKPHPIRGAPFHAVRLAAGMTYTMGGIAINGSAQVLGEGDQPIAGLYAAGCATGGLEGGEHIAYIGGLTKSTVTALRAAQHIGEQLGKTQ
ncbi:MAG TPA: FAD-dependent oxidoreductase [Ramlibacter sp.]|nr:FAD-dependent oxidoreductase [Ramlibacter sp.]